MATKKETERIIQLTKITGLTGGGAGNLDGIATVGYAVGLRAIFWNEASDEVSFYRLAAGTTAESSPSIIRPDDYAGTTNEKIWKKQTVV